MAKVPNLTAVTWAHAVNSREQLNNALKSNVAMIEADIVLGKVNNCEALDQPIMAHPPETTSDISLDQFLKIINEHNCNETKHVKGIKLDFKSIEVFERSLDILQKHLARLTFPVWLNADIVCGPVNSTIVPVDPDRFLAGCYSFENFILSIGWTTRWDSNCVKGSYTNEDIDQMLNVIKKNNATKHQITFPVRAAIAAQSIEQLKNLLQQMNDSNKCSITIWSSPQDDVDIEKLRELILTLGLDRVYLDVPSELSSRLNLCEDKEISASLAPVIVNS